MQQTTASEASGITAEQNHVMIKVPTFDRVMRAVLPDEALMHLRNARRESLLAVRSMIDARLQELDAADQASASSRRVDIVVE